MSGEEPENNTTVDLKSGPFSVLWKAVKGNTQVLVNVRNNHSFGCVIIVLSVLLDSCNTCMTLLNFSISLLHQTILH